MKKQQEQTVEPGSVIVRKTISMREDLWAASVRLRKQKMFDDYSAYIQDLIRRDMERDRTNGPTALPQFVQSPDSAAKSLSEERGPLNKRSGTR